MSPELGFFGILLAAFFAGIAGSGHCLGMCGGIAGSMGAGCSATGLKRSALMSSFNLGRVFGYCVMGALAGALTGLGINLIGGHGLSVLRIIAGLLLIAVGLHLAFRWRGLDRLASLAAPLWRRMSPLFRRLLPMQSHPQALVLGMIWGWLPCGLVYGLLATAASSASWLQGLLIMAAFGAGTLPSMLATSLGGQTLLGRLNGPMGRRLGGGLMILFGLWTIFGPLLMGLIMGANGSGEHHH